MSTIIELPGLKSHASKSASFSPCRRYRYDLFRRWDDGPYSMFIGLNPSTADELLDDPTVRRCIAYSKRWGYSALCMMNLFAYRATDPKEMMKEEHHDYGMNTKVMIQNANDAAIVVAAWGKDGSHVGRGKAIINMLREYVPDKPLHALKLNEDGSPSHPLYLRGDLKPFLLQ